MLGPVLGALSYLHQRGLTHGHLRPTNIMVIDDHVKLSPDFGWCSSIRNIYDPPEAGAGNVAPAADIWSLGILLVEALTQQPPAWDRSQGGEPEIPATIPEPFFTICRECLRTDPERRCALAAIEARLNPPQAAEPAVQPAPQPPVPELTAAPEPRAATAPARSRAPTAQPAPAQAPASANPEGGVVKGSVAHQAPPDISAKILGAVQGHFNVRIRVEVDPEGNVSQASFDWPGPSRYFANQALRAAQNWKFTPAKVDGRAVASTWLLQFQFGQSQSAATQSEESP
jgi:TonB family protein